MEKMYVILSNVVELDEERVMKLDYCLTENLTETEPAIPYFGIQINKKLNGDLETEKVIGISHSKDTVMAYIKKLAQFAVTPISMVEVLDDMITEESC